MMRRKTSEMKNFPYNMLKSFGLEQENYPEDIDETVLYMLELADMSAGKERAEIVKKYFAEGMSYEKTGACFGISSETVRRMIGQTVKKLECKRYREMLKVGKKQYEQTHSKEVLRKQPVEEMCISAPAKQVLLTNGITTVEQLISLDGHQLRRLHNPELYGMEYKMSEYAFKEIVYDLTTFYGVNPEQYKEIPSSTLYPNNLFEELGLGKISGQFSPEFISNFNEIVESTDGNPYKNNYKRTLLRFNENLSYQKIAEISGKSATAVKYSINKTLHRLHHWTKLDEILNLIAQELQTNENILIYSKELQNTLNCRQKRTET